MKYSKSIIAIASLFIAGVVFAATTEPKVAGCCTKAKADGKTCAHACCVEAAKAGDNCTKCGGAGKVAAPAKK